MTPKGRKALRDLLHHSFHLIDDSEDGGKAGISIDPEIAKPDLKGISDALGALGINDHEDIDRLLPATPSEKVAHVKRAGQTRDHQCHWPGCQQQVPPAQWGCKTHWFKLPKALRDRIWATYRPGQEERADPSAAYLEAADAVQVWIRSEWIEKGKA